MKIHPEQKKIFISMTPGQKLEIAQRLFYSAIELKEAGLRSQYPTYSEKEIKEKLRNILLNAGS